MVKHAKMIVLWRVIRAQPGLRLPDLSASSRLTYTETKWALQALRKRGCVRYEGTARYAYWHAVGAEPIDLRGISPASLANLKMTPEQQAARLRLANIGKGRDPDKMQRKGPYVPRGGFVCTLQRCWTGGLSLTQEEA